MSVFSSIETNLKRSAIALGIAAAVAAPAFAATQGTIGATSQGSVLISLDVDDVLQISGLTDILGLTFTGADVSGSTDACVYRNGGLAYSVTATGDGGAGGTDFSLSDAGGANSVPYTVSFDDGSGGSPLTSGTAATMAGASDATDCNSTPNVQVTVDIAAADAAAAPAGSYTGTLTLLVDAP
ncbi:MAG: hypothetical protein AAF515_04905 [Pseudomonadota bacterium]